MSHYQWVHFQAIDKPLDDEQLEFMEQQSSRAEVSKWEFSCQYNYSDFNGPTHEMLRRGFDVHVHFCSYGMRYLMLRLPELPCDKKTFKTFASPGNLEWIPDTKGTAGILSLTPESDDDYGDYLDNVESFGDRLAGVRELLIAGDLRPLYLFWLVNLFSIADADEEDRKEPPVPAGLRELLKEDAPNALDAIIDFYQLPWNLLSVAAEKSEPAPAASDQSRVVSNWLRKRSKADLLTTCEDLLLGDTSARQVLLTHIRREINQPTWPMTRPSRTVAELLAALTKADRAAEEQEEADRLAARAKEIRTIVKNPKKLIKQIDACVATKKRDGYQEAAAHLKEFAEAMGLEAAQAEIDRLYKEHPRGRSLKQEIRVAGF